MAREAIKFSAKGLENLKAESKTYKVRDTQAVSFFVCVMKIGKNSEKGLKNGTKTFQYRWRRKVEVAGKLKEKDTDIVLGRVGEIDLADARGLARECHALARVGNDPRLVLGDKVKVISDGRLGEMFREAFKVRTSFYPEDFNPETPNLELHPKGFKKSYQAKIAISRDLVSFGTARDMKSRVETHLLPKLGERDVLEVKPFELDEIIAAIQPKVESGKTIPMLDTRRKLFSDMQIIFKYARSHFPNMIYAPTDAVDMKKHLKDFANEKTHMVSTTDVEGIEGIMWKLCTHLATSTRMSWQLKVATLALPLTHLRPGELVALRWSEIDFKKGLINIPGAYKAHTEKPEKRMKMGRDHIIPMSRQLKDLLKQTKEYSKRQGIVSRYVLPAPMYKKDMDLIRDQKGKVYIDECVSVAGLENTLKRAGISNQTELTPHGWRAMASTRINGGLTINGEKIYYDSKWVEVALSHHSILKQDGGKMAEAYNHAKYLPERTEMIQDWADFLEGFILTCSALQSLHQPTLLLLVQPTHKSYQLA